MAVNQREILKELLLRDYDYRAEALKNSEETGEMRLNLFFGVVTIVVGALVTLSTREAGPKGDDLLRLIIAVLFVLLVLGFVTLQRLIVRNLRTDECKRDLDHIRQTFKDHFDDELLLHHYHPVGGFPDVKDKDDKKLRFLPGWGKLRKLGGMADTMSAINCLLMIGFVGALLWRASYPIRDNLRMSFSIGILTLIAQLAYSRYREFRGKHKLREDEVNRVGGVVYSYDDQESLRFLLVKPKKPKGDERVLPKGHIRGGEFHLETALREVKEEAGMLADSEGVLDIIHYTVDKETVHAKFYLLTYQRETESHELRDPRWYTIGDALRLVPDETRDLLHLAYYEFTGEWYTEPEADE